MEKVSRSFCKRVILLLVFASLCLSATRAVHAVPGQLNNSLCPTTNPIDTITCPNAKAYEECNQKYVQAQKELENCQNAASLTLKTDINSDTDEHAFLIWAIVSTVIAVIFGAFYIATLVKKKKTNQPPPSSPVIPPFTS